MGRSTLSVLGLYNYDNTLFEWMELPFGVDRDILIKNLLLETAEFEVLYTSPYILKHAIFVWSKKEKPIWEKLYNTTVLEYNPIHNYDMYDDWTDEGKRTDDLQHGIHTVTDIDTTHGGTDVNTTNTDIAHYVTGDDTTTRTDALVHSKDGSETATRTDDLTETHSGNDKTHSKTLNDVYAYNSETAVHKDEQTTDTQTDFGHVIKNTGTQETETVYDIDESDTGTQTTVVQHNTTNTDSGDVTDTTKYGKTEQTLNKQDGTSTDTGTVENKNDHKGHKYGNLGVMTTQDMIVKQREVVQFVIDDFIINSFKKRFCLLIY